MCELVQHQCDCIIAASRATAAHDQSYADTDEKGTEQCRRQREGGQIGQQIADLLKQYVKQRKAERCNCSIDYKGLSQKAKTDAITDCVQAKLGNAGRYAEMVMQQQGGSQHTAFGDSALRVYIIEPECKDRRSEQQGCVLFPILYKHSLIIILYRVYKVNRCGENKV